MTTYDSRSAPMGAAGLPQPRRWCVSCSDCSWCWPGLMVLGDVALFTVVSALFIGWMLIATGAFEIFHAFWTKGWGGLPVAGGARCALHRPWPHHRHSAAGRRCSCSPICSAWCSWSPASCGC